MCQVSFSEPGLFRRRRERNVAMAGLSRERPSGEEAGAGAAGCKERCRRLGNGAVELGVQLLEHAGSFFAARHAKVQPLSRILRTARSHSPCSYSRTGRNPAAPSPPSCRRGSGRPSASFMRSAIGMAGSCQGAPSSSSVTGAPPARGGAVDQSGQQLSGVGIGEWRDAFLQAEQSGEKAVEPGALLRRERRRLSE